VKNKALYQDSNTQFCSIDPAQRGQFKQFVNTPEQRAQSEIITERGQRRPADWPKSYPPVQLTTSHFKTGKENWTWITVAKTSDMVTTDAGTASVAVKYGDTQLSIYHVPQRGYYATQQMYVLFCFGRTLDDILYRKVPPPKVISCCHGEVWYSES
jgi:hypothetical protein